MTYMTRTMSVIVAPENEPLFSEICTTVSIVDEGGGEFVEVTQNYRGDAKIAIEPGEWGVLMAAIDRMIGECRAQENKT